MSRAALRLVVVGALLAVATPSLAVDKRAAREAYSEGSRYYDLNQFDDALGAFKRAYWNYESPYFLYNIAQCHRQLGHAAEAASFYRTYLRKMPDATNRAEVEQLIQSLESKLAADARPTPVPTTAATTPLPRSPLAPVSYPPFVPPPPPRPVAVALVPPTPVVHGRFGPVVRVPVGVPAVSLTVGNFDRDDHPDLAIVDRQNLHVLLSHAAGDFVPTRYTTGVEPTAVVAGDFNGDHLADLAVVHRASGDLAILLNHGDGTFGPATTHLPAGQAPSALAVGDFNGDHRLDLLVVAADSGLAIPFIGDGAGRFTLGSPVGVGQTPLTVATGDLDGDGDLDVVVGNFDSNAVSILLNNGDGSFTPSAPVDDHVGGPRGLWVTDLNGDGRADLVVANSVGSSVALFYNRGGAHFDGAQVLPTPSEPTAVAAADFDGHGHRDLAVATRDGNVLIFSGDGHEQFAAPLAYPTGGEPRALVATDLDGDHRPDLVTADQEGRSVTVYYSRTR